MTSTLDSRQWSSGRDKIEWARRFMPVTATLADELRRSGTLERVRVGLSLVLEPKTANLALRIAEAGADVSVVCDAANTRDDVADALRHNGIAVFARSDADAQTDRRLALEFLDRRHDILIDDGAHLIRLAHDERPDTLRDTIGASEETTSGLRPLRRIAGAGELRIPVIAANDARCKTLFDNGYGTGQSTVFTIADLLGSTLAGASVAVAGYGYVGRGVARAVSALGATVTVSEIDPVAALEALHAGFGVAPLVEAAADADLVISAAGVEHTIGVEHLLALPDGAAVAVAGGVDQEIAIAAALDAGASRRTVADRVEEFRMPNGRSVLVLDRGECINCTAGEGNPIEVMDLSFGVQLLAIEVLATVGATLYPGVHPLPEAADIRVARTKLDSLGIRIDAEGPSR